jgi:hypothetical protein
MRPKVTAPTIGASAASADVLWLMHQQHADHDLAEVATEKFLSASAETLDARVAALLDQEEQGAGVDAAWGMV